MSLQGHSGQKTSFSGTAIHGKRARNRRQKLTLHPVKQSGHAVLTVKVPGGAEEKYLITLRKSCERRQTGR